MPEHGPLTEAEVAELERRFDSPTFAPTVHRLIADWRRLRAENEPVPWVNKEGFVMSLRPADAFEYCIRERDALRSLVGELVRALIAYKAWRDSAPAIIGGRYYQDQCKEREAAKRKLGEEIDNTLARAAEMGIK